MRVRGLSALLLLWLLPGLGFALSWQRWSHERLLLLGMPTLVGYGVVFIGASRLGLWRINTWPKVQGVPVQIGLTYGGYFGFFFALSLSPGRAWWCGGALTALSCTVLGGLLDATMVAAGVLQIKGAPSRGAALRSVLGYSPRSFGALGFSMGSIAQASLHLEAQHPVFGVGGLVFCAAVVLVPFGLGLGWWRGRASA